MNIFAYFLIGALASAATPHGSECRVVSVVDEVNPWEEGLGVYGDPQSDSDSVSVTFEWDKEGAISDVGVGQTKWRISNGASIRMMKQGNGFAYRMTRPKDRSSVEVKVYESERGVILYRERSQKPWLTVGTFDCSNVDGVTKASLNDANVRRLSKPERTALPAAVKENIDKVDIAFELGDGYYDLRGTRLYEVTSPKASKDVVGFIQWARLYYTEDNEEVLVLVRFDRNGLRLSEIEKL